MLTDAIFKELLSKHQIRDGLWEHFENAIRDPIESAINEGFDAKPNYRYGGSLAKRTANKDSCDIDLLVYFDSETQLSVRDIYNGIASALTKAGYLIQKKNSAILVCGKDYKIWEDITVDVVPGKYSSGGDEKDVYLYCNKDDSRLKSNPEKQIKKIQSSKMKDVVRIIKILKKTHNFAFKSFFLEIFAVDVVEPCLNGNSSLVEKLIEFSKHYSEIGITKIYDPANPNGNNIMDIHSNSEFFTIREFIKNLYEVLLTDDEQLVINYLTSKSSINDLETRIAEAYQKNAKQHSNLLNYQIRSPLLSLSCHIKGTSTNVQSGDTVDKETYLRFEINKSSFYSGYDFKFVISNAGYEARIANQLRGSCEESNVEISPASRLIREEHTTYNGNHYVQVVGFKAGSPTLYSSLFVVKVRDFKSC